MFFLKHLFKMREQSQAEAVKPFLDHLEDLRWTLMKMIFTLFSGMIICFAFRKHIFHFMEYPMLRIGMNPKEVLMVTAAPEIITSSVTLSFYASLVVTFPFLLYYLAQFILPALTLKEKRVVLPGVAVGFVLFLAGATSCFLWILPQTLAWLRDETASAEIRISYTLREYFSFVSHLTIAFGLLAELPVLTVSLNRLGVLSYEWLASTRLYAFTLILILSAIISPTMDIMTMLVLAFPIGLLYEICIWIVWFLERRDKRKESQAAQP
jgi:sec-independent protein translocase protein TatC